MFFSLKQSRRAPRPQGIRPSLESLERRDCPSFLGAQPSQELWYFLNTAPVINPGPALKVQHNFQSGGGGSGNGNPSPPAFTALNVTYISKTNITITGILSDSDPGGLTVYFTGQATGSAIVNSDGSFTFNTNATGLGAVNLYAVDRNGLGTPATSVTLTAPVPVISDVVAVEGPNYLFTFTGLVTAQNPGGLTVTFGGVPTMVNQTATVNPDGTFALTIQLSNTGSDDGNVSAQTTDWWGQASNVDLTGVFVTT